MKKVLLYIGSLGSGGAERQLVYTATGLKDKGYAVKVIINYPRYHYLQKLEEKKIEVICTNSPGKRLFRRYLILIKVFLSYRPDIVHSFTGNKNLEMMFLSFIFFIETRIASIRNVSKNEFKYFKFYSLFSKKIVCNSEKAKIKLEKLYGKNKKIEVVYNGMDFEDFNVEKNLLNEVKKELKKDNRIGVCIGRVVKQKNQIELIKAIVRLYKEKKLYEKDIFYFVGKIDDKKRYQEIVEILKKSNLEDKVKFLGERKNIKEILQISDYLVLPSLYEGFPNVVMEAMVMNTLVIATSVGGTPELIENKKTGLLIDEPKEECIYEKINEYLKFKEEEKIKIIAQAKSKIMKFSIKNLVKNTEEVYLQ